MQKKKEMPPLTGKQNRFLRALGHHLEQSVIVGREGLTAGVIRSCDEVLLARELMKVKLGQNCPIEKKEAAREIAGHTGAHLVQLIGKTILLYRANPELPPDASIQLPR